MYISTKKFIFSVLFLALLYLFFLPAYLVEPTALHAAMAAVVLGYGLWLLIAGFRWRKREQALLEAALGVLKSDKKLSSKKLAEEIGIYEWATQTLLLTHRRKGKLPSDITIE
jgi:hypothetical protein